MPGLHILTLYAVAVMIILMPLVRRAMVRKRRKRVEQIKKRLETQPIEIREIEFRAASN
jgi:hypothetical protein